MIGWVRTWLFRLAFYGGSIAYVLATPVAALFGARALRGVVLGWVRYHAVCAALFAGIRTRLVGVPAGQALYAAKHQSFYETFELVRLLDAPAVVMRREYGRIPLWGWAAKRYGVIMIDRAGSAAALRGMMREAAAARAAGRSVVIFPEGTRVAPGSTPPLKPGFAGLYRALGLPTVAIALNSGLVWPRRGAMRPGIVTIDLAEAIAPGRPRAEIEAQVHAAINRLEVPGDAAGDAPA